MGVMQRGQIEGAECSRKMMGKSDTVGEWRHVPG